MEAGDQVLKAQDVNEGTPPVEATQATPRLTTVAARVTPEEKRAIRVAAARGDKTPSEYIRALVLPTALREAA